jgi:hypothetical protein
MRVREKGGLKERKKGLHTLGGMPVTREQIRVARAEIIRVKHTTFYTIAFGRGLGPMLVMSSVHVALGVISMGCGSPVVCDPDLRQQFPPVRLSGCIQRFWFRRVQL